MTSTSAPGHPGIPPRWTSSTKVGIGTAYSASSRVWFTLSHGIVNEIYYPLVDSPNTRDLQLLITDGETFCHEEKRDLVHQCERPEREAMLYRLTNYDPNGRYRIVKEIISEPHSSVVLMSVKVEILDASLLGKLTAFVLLAPHVADTGGGNSARVCDIGGQSLLHANRDDVHLILGCSRGFVRRSVGFVGVSDGWRDLMDNFQMDWQYDVADDGNVAMIGEVDLSAGPEFTIGVGFGESRQMAATQLRQAFVHPFGHQRERFVQQWRRVHQPDWSDDRDTASMVRLSQRVLMAHEDKTFSGATVASMSIPWGETKDDRDRGGYHLVWARDMVQTATGALACDETEMPLRALAWLASIQGDDGGMPQNSAVDGNAYWKGIQLDEVAAPVLLAWRLKQAGALSNFDSSEMVRRAMRYLIANGPVTAQERWEENSGYSPSTLATIIAAVVCAADFANESEAKFLLDYADWLVASLKNWTVTSCGELVPGKPRHFVRITPESPQPGRVDPNPDTAMVTIANGGGNHPARDVVDAGFLQLVRLGIVDAHDSDVVDSVTVVDAILKRDLPQGPCWRRYNHDGYGEHADGNAFDGSGEGRSWPLLTGERGHYELAAGRDATSYLKAMERFASEGGLLAEQLWDADDIPEHELIFGEPTGSAMPLCWAHAEYITLARSIHDGVCFDRVEPVYRRYAVGRQSSNIEVWTLHHQLARIAAGKVLRIILDSPATVHWTDDRWKTQHDCRTQSNALGLHYLDLPHQQSESLSFTFHWTDVDRWEGIDYHVELLK